MFVYGIQCVLTETPNGDIANYDTDYNIMYFPSYTVASVIQSNGILSDRFWKSVKNMVENQSNTFKLDLEDPYISDEQHKLIQKLNATSHWFYIPRVSPVLSA